MSAISKKVISECQQKLLEKKSEILNQVRTNRGHLRKSLADFKGDEADQTVRLIQESEAVSLHERFRFQLVEIEAALSRIEDGTFGVCEETEELIGKERLLAIPWTRLSIEGAELREDVMRRYA